MNYQKIGMEFTELLPSNIVANMLVDQWVWLLLKWYYAPFEMIGRGDEVDQWVSTFSLNGIKQSSICKV
jgi:hypothetical protein